MSDVKKRRVLPAVGAAFLVAGGAVYVAETGQIPFVTTDGDDEERVVRMEVTTTDVVTVVAVAKSHWRGELLSTSESVSRFRVYEVRLAPGETGEFIVIGVQEAVERRQSVTCRITVNNGKVTDDRAVVRRGERKEVKCAHKG